MSLIAMHAVPHCLPADFAAGPRTAGTCPQAGCQCGTLHEFLDLTDLVIALQHAGNMMGDSRAVQQSSEEAWPAAPVENRAAGKRKRSVANTDCASEKKVTVGVPSTALAVSRPGSPDFSTWQSEVRRYQLSCSSGLELAAAGLLAASIDPRPFQLQ